MRKVVSPFALSMVQIHLILFVKKQENLKDPISNIMEKHEDAIRELAQTAFGAATFRGFVQRWEINKEPPPPTEAEKRPASQISSFASVPYTPALRVAPLTLDPSYVDLSFHACDNPVRTRICASRRLRSIGGRIRVGEYRWTCGE